jgi:hypothetical protein
MRRKGWLKTEATVDEVYVDGHGKYRQASVVFIYLVGGHYYSGTYTPWINIPVKGEKIPLRYDPDDPETNDLVIKSTKTRWLMGLAAALAFALMLFLQFS